MLALIFLSAGVARSQDAAVNQLRPSTWRERFSSPRIEALRREIGSGRATTEAFWLQKLFISRNRLPLRFYLNAGSFEAQFWGGPGGVNGTLESNRHMRDVLLARGYDVYYREFVGGHDYLSWRGLFADGLIALIGKN